MERPVKESASKLSSQDYRKIFEGMMRIRLLDERGMQLQRQGRIGFYLPQLGEEALQVGSAMALEPEDWILPSYRVAGVALWRGVTLEEMVHNLFGTSKDSARGRQMPVHYSFRQANFVSVSSPIGTQIVQASGVGIAMNIKGDRKVVVTYMGDGATSSNDFHVGMNFAGVFKAPVVFICNNNQWAISVPLSHQTAAESIAIKAKAYGFEGVSVDGNDCLAVYEATRYAVDKARAGKGPTLIEAITFRMGPHSTADDPKRYVPPEEFETWKKKDPIHRFRTFLQEDGLWKEEWEQGMVRQIKEEINEAISKVANTPPPPVDSLFDGVYAEQPWHLQEQRQQVKEQEEHG